jgi:light-regulated signal transduction histidine kinase (bacteriophytochrome)
MAVRSERADERLNAEVERLRSEVERLTAEIGRANEDLRQVLYAASHDLAEPLQIVLSYAELLAARAGNLDESAQTFLAGIQSGSARIRILIDALLSYSRVGRDPLERVEVDCTDVLDETLELLAPSIAESGAKIVPEPLPTVWGDPTELRLLFENLVDNAIKFRGAEPLRIRISAAREEEGWCFSVRDNGIGIHPRQHQRIFEIFQRLHTRQEYPGAGLGLAICAKIVRHHGGRIWVESRPGLGSTFRFTIPVSPQYVH